MRKILTAALVLGFLGSCTEPTQGMFYSIEKETKTGDSSNALPNTITVMGTAVRAGAEETLYLASGSLYRKTSSQDWERVTPRIPGLSSPAVLDTAALGSTLFILAGADGDRNIYASTADLDFSLVSPGSLEGSPAALIPVEGDSGSLLVSWSTPENGFQLHLLTVSGLSPLPLLPSPVSKGVVQAVFTPSGYFAVSPSFIFKGPDLNTALTVETPVLEGVSAGNLGGVVFSAALNGTGTKEIILSTSRGTLLRETPAPGTGWEVYPGITALSDSGTPAELGILTEWSTGGTPDLVLLAGAFRKGYAEAWYDGAADTPKAVLEKTGKTVDSVSFSTSALGQKTVTGFQRFSGSLYAESPAGLWKYSNRSWSWE